MKIIELFGAAGCGKTFMMNYIVKINENSISQYDFPVYVIFNSRKAILTLKKFHNLYKLIRIVALSYILLCYSRRVSNNYEMLIKNYKQLLISSTISKEAIKARLKMLHRSLVYYDLALNNSNQEYLVMDEGFI